MPSERDKHYDGNIARYLLDLHDEVRRFQFYMEVVVSWMGEMEKEERFL
jgi:hypothetical protein